MEAPAIGTFCKLHNALVDRGVLDHLPPPSVRSRTVVVHPYACTDNASKAKASRVVQKKPAKFVQKRGLKK